MLNIVKEISEGKAKARVSLADLQRQMPELDEIAEELAEATAGINTVEIVTPANAKAEQELWMTMANEGKFIDPEFEYDLELLAEVTDRQLAIKRLLKKLLDMQVVTDEETLVWKMMIQRAEDALKSISLAESIYQADDRGSVRNVLAKYGQPDRELVTRAWDLAGELQEKRTPDKTEAELTAEQQALLNEKKCDAAEIRRWFQRALELNGIAGMWPVVIDEKARAINVQNRSASGRRIVIPSDREASAMKVLELIGHEIECHARDNANGTVMLHDLGGGTLKTDCEILSEGHAKLSDIEFARKYQGKILPAPKPWYVLAISWAKSGMAFSKVAGRLYDLMLSCGMKPETALKTTWATAYRVFRGICDCTNPYGYAFTKDMSYLVGQMMASELEDAGLAYYLEIGILSPEDLVRIASTVKISPEKIAYPYVDAAAQICKEMLAELV